MPYHIYFQVLNAKHYGIPQNRERVFIIGIRDDEDNDFQFPKPFPLKKRLKDVLESEVDEKYFLSDTMLNWIDKHREKRQSSGKYPFTEKDDTSGCITAIYNKMGAEDIFIGTWRTHEDGKGFRATEDNNCPTIPARAREDGSGQPVIKVNQLNLSKESGGKQPFQQNRVYDVEGILPTLDTDSRAKNILVDDIKIGAIRGRNPDNPKSRQSGLEIEQMLEINENGTSNALTTVQKDNVVVITTNNSKGFDVAEEEEDSINFSNPNSETRRGRVGKKVSQTLDTACNQGIVTKKLSKQELEKYEGISVHPLSKKLEFNGFKDINCPTLLATDYKAPKCIKYNTQRIRRLTPTEAFRLMDFNENFKWNVSDSQAYKQAGNSICVGVLAAIIEKLNL